MGQSVVLDRLPSSCNCCRNSYDLTSTTDFGENANTIKDQTPECTEDTKASKVFSSLPHQTVSTPSRSVSPGNLAAAQVAKELPKCNTMYQTAEKVPQHIPSAPINSGYQEGQHSGEERHHQLTSAPLIESSAACAASPQAFFEDVQIELEAKPESPKEESSLPLTPRQEVVQERALQEPDSEVHVPSQIKDQSGHRRISVEGIRMPVPASGMVTKPFPKRPLMSKLSQACWNRLEELFKHMDADGSSQVTNEEALMFFKGAFNKFSCEAMFNEVDVDKSGQITAEEFMDFWVQVRSNGYSEQSILDEIDMLLEGGTWVDWKDGRDTTHQQKITFPKRPWLCAVSRENWALLQKLFMKMDSDNQMVVTRDNASNFFRSGGYASVSTDAMFNEVDVTGKGIITADDWMKFWRQVRGSGYSNKQVNEEVKSLLEGNAWVDWLDGRRT